MLRDIFVLSGNVISLRLLSREAVEKEFTDFIDGSNFSSLQLAFVKKVIDYFVEDGFVREGLLYEAQFEDMYQDGPESLFDDVAEVLFAKIKSVNGIEVETLEL